jgi:hypothetical protein
MKRQVASQPLDDGGVDHAAALVNHLRPNLAGLESKRRQLDIGRQRPATHGSAGTDRVTVRTSFQTANRQSSIAP